MIKYIAPIIITAIAVIYALVIAILIFATMAFSQIPTMAIILILIGPVGIAALFVTVLVLRIKEIKGGEEDAASKY